MAYQIPRVEIEEAFIQNPVFTVQPLNACIVGPQFALHRYGIAGEKPTTVVTHPSDSGLANTYQFASDVTYVYPQRPSNSVIDQDYAKVYFEKAEAKYFPLEGLGSNDGDTDVEYTEAPSGLDYTNRIRFLGAVLKTGNGTDRSAFFAERDVKVGDVVVLTDENELTHRSTVKRLIADTHKEDSALDAVSVVTYKSGTNGVVSGGSLNVLTSSGATFAAADVGRFITINTKGTFKIIVVNSATSVTLDRNTTAGTGLTYAVRNYHNDTSNLGPVTGALGTPTYGWVGSGADPGASAISVDESASGDYNGYIDKRILADTYVVTVTTGGNLSAVRFSIESAQGAFAAKTNVALVSSVLQVEDARGSDLILDFTGSTNFVVGQKYTWAVSATVAQVQAVPSGTYTGPADITYKLYVVRGGAFYDGSNSATCALIQVSASSADASSSVFVASATAFNVGSYGVLATISSGSGTTDGADPGLILGDSYYVHAKAAQLGAFRTVELNDAIPVALLNSVADKFASLYLVRSSMVVPKLADVLSETFNWTTTTTGLTLKAGIETTDAALVIADNLVKLPIERANVFVEYRALLRTYSASLDAVTSLAQVSTKLGTVHPDNPLAQGVYEAMLNAKNVAVRFIGVETNDLAGYNAALKVLKFKKNVYSIVPMTFDSAVQDAVVAHVAAMSTKEEARWRICWLSKELTQSALIYDQNNGEDWLGTITDDPTVSGTQYTYLTVAGATFLTDEVRVGDTVLINFRLDSEGNVISDEYTVAEVRTETTLALDAGPDVAVNVDTQVKIRRNYTKDEQASTLAVVAGDYNNRRVRTVFPDVLYTNGVEKAGYFAAASLAGLRSGVVPHQGLTNIQVLGYDNLPRSVTYFNDDQLNTLAEQGVFIITQDVLGATAYVRHQLTTDTSALNTSEDSVTTNVDSFCYSLQDKLAPFIGIYNRNPETMVLIKDTVNAEIRFRQTQTFNATAGYQFLVGSKLSKIEVDPDFKDKVNIEIVAEVPYPLNRIGVLVIVL